MAARKNTDRITVRRSRGSVTLDMGPIEIWDGADLSLVRDMLVHVIEKESYRRVAINMAYVKYVPSGFFGMLLDWHDRGIEIELAEPQPNVQDMLWFRRFFSPGNNPLKFVLMDGPETPFSEDDSDECDLAEDFDPITLEPTAQPTR